MSNDINKHSEMRSINLGPILGHLWEQSRGTISLLLVGACVLAFVSVALLDLLDVVSRRQIVFFLALSQVGIFEHLWLHQFLTAPLLHANITHLLFNMLALWMLGPGVEHTLGRRHYIFFSILCSVCSMAGFLLVNWGTGNVAWGYSSVIFGILVGQAMFFPNSMMLILVFTIKMKYAVLILGAVELYLTISPEESGIAHAAHLFGAVAAFVYLRVIRLRKIRGEQRKHLTDNRARPKLVRRRRRKEVPREL